MTEFFVETHGPASMTIKRQQLTPLEADALIEQGFYVELATCDCTGWEHVLGTGILGKDGLSYGCPGPVSVEPRDCCGVPDDNDVTRRCEIGCCTIVYCGSCGTDSMLSWGPVRCPCQDRDRPRTYTPAERRMIPTPNGREYTRRQRARRKR